MKAVVIGAGRCGCGFMGQLLHTSGYEVVFVVRDPILESNFDRVGSYRLLLTDKSEMRDILVDTVRAVSVTDCEKIAAEIADADILVTAMGAKNLPCAAPLIALGLHRRHTPLNILACENLTAAGPYLRRLVAAHLPRHFPLNRHGFSGVLVSRAVSQRLGDPCGSAPLAFVGDTLDFFVVSGPDLRDPLPAIQGMIVVDNYDAWIQHKLYTYSAGHAACAYLGHLQGYRYIHTAMQDADIRAAVFGAMQEGEAGLIARYGSNIAGGLYNLTAVLERFDNPALADSVLRVGRDPLRKLRPRDRLVGPAKLAMHAGLQPANLIAATAAALCFYDPGDPSACALQRQLSTLGVEAVLEKVCGLNPRQGLGRRIAMTWMQLTGGQPQRQIPLRSNQSPVGLKSTLV